MEPGSLLRQLQEAFPPTSCSPDEIRHAVSDFLQSRAGRLPENDIRELLSHLDAVCGALKDHIEAQEVQRAGRRGASGVEALTHKLARCKTESSKGTKVSAAAMDHRGPWFCRGAFILRVMSIHSLLKVKAV